MVSVSRAPPAASADHYAGVDADWFQVFLGGMVLFAVMLNQFVRRRAMGVR